MYVSARVLYGVLQITGSYSVPMHEKKQCIKLKPTLQTSWHKVRMSVCGPLKLHILNIWKGFQVLHGQSLLLHHQHIVYTVLPTELNLSLIWRLNLGLNWICQSSGDDAEIGDSELQKVWCTLTSTIRCMLRTKSMLCTSGDEKVLISI